MATAQCRASRLQDVLQNVESAYHEALAGFGQAAALTQAVAYAKAACLIPGNRCLHEPAAVTEHTLLSLPKAEGPQWHPRPAADPLGGCDEQNESRGRRLTVDGCCAGFTGMRRRR